jgi:hypothetical protein
MTVLFLMGGCRLPFSFACTPKRHSLVESDIVPQNSRFSDDDFHPVIDIVWRVSSLIAPISSPVIFFATTND